MNNLKGVRKYAEYLGSVLNRIVLATKTPENCNTQGKYHLVMSFPDAISCHITAFSELL